MRVYEIAYNHVIPGYRRLHAFRYCLGDSKYMYYDSDRRHL